jgi:Tfp pilus assembly protein PilZ
MRVHAQAGPEELRRTGEARIDVVVAAFRDGRAQQDLRERIERELGGSVQLLLVASELGSATKSPAIADASTVTRVVPADAHRVAFEILVTLCDDPYTRSRLLRVESELPVVVAGFGSTQLVNLSFGGAFVALPPEHLKDLAAPQVGAVLDLSLWITDQHAVRTRATVVWTRPAARVATPSGVGVRFDDLDAADQARLEDFVRWKRIEALRSSTSALRRHAAAV